MLVAACLMLLGAGAAVAAFGGLSGTGPAASPSTVPTGPSSPSPPDRTTPGPAAMTTPSTSTPGGTTSGSAGTRQYARTCRTTAWYSSYLPGGSYIHFKCVDESSDTTVAEALGSDNIDLQAESQRAIQNAKRVELVKQLETKLEARGWQQIGMVPGGEWYQLRFGKP